MCRISLTTLAKKKANFGGTALPICLQIEVFDPINSKESGKD
jgi:hypothetical protein